MTLKELIDALSISRKIKICVHDVTGVLNNEVLRLPFDYCIHSGEFCNLAKSSDDGYMLCTTHKNRVNHLCIKGKKQFFGRCPYGISEVVYPVIALNKVLCIIYIGNICPDINITEKYIDQTARKTGVSDRELKELACKCENIEPKQHINTAKIIADYILQNMIHGENYNFHFAVSFAKRYANTYFMHDLHLSQIAELCRINEKYLGRIFKEQACISFREYLMNIRLEKARDLLKQTSKSVTEICFFCGFNEITYFNHVFKKKYMLSPSEYRKENK